MSRSLSTMALIAGLVALALAVRWVAAGPESGAAPPGRPPYVLPVTLGQVERGTLAPRATLTGSVRSQERSQVGFRLPGRVAALSALAGDRVAEGALLARLEDDDQRAALARAAATLALAERQLALAEAGERPEERLRLAAELEQRRAESELADSEVRRNSELLGKNVIAQSSYDALVAQSKAARARVAAAEQELASAQSGTRSEELDIARAEVELRRTDVTIARTELAKTELRAPFEAHVVAKLASLGETVAAGATVYELIDLARREVTLEVPADVALRLRAGGMATLRLDEAPDFRLELPLDAVVAAADEASRNFRAIVRLGAERDRAVVLRPGLFVRAEVELAPIEDAWIVPEDALRVVEAGTIVVRAVPAADAQGLAAEWIAVRVLGTQGGRAAIEPLEQLEAGLAAGDRVVLTGVDLAFPGVPLVVPGEASPESGP